ncbi:sigma 54-interacting transcriptional regulator [Brevibacillus panacihumi]|uniref:AAA family ATPase n=1 Tax=Brevibacillus panacihumi TaxID=497735 RepID=A0A3M8D2E3_9BACL|nr:sigma 54-interacting transcriptional regulator [Brevibacillus panacihumi]RNB81879.1 AAA family ATPase [Brevibacillus panacihumi]
MSDLRKIVSVAQEVAEAIKAAFQMDVEIIDAEVKRIAATGSAKKKIGAAMAYGTVTRHVLQNTEPIVIHQPGQEDFCLACQGYGKCTYTGGIIVPILYKNRTIGTINVVAYDQQRMQVLQQNQTGLIEFLNRMAELMTSKIAEQELYEEQIRVNSALLTLINTISNGVLSIDQEGRIRQANSLAEQMLRGSEQAAAMEGMLVTSVFPDFPLAETLNAKEFKSYELAAKVNGKGYRYIADIKPVTADDAVTGAVVSIVDYENMKQLAFDFATPNRQITFQEIICETPHMQHIKTIASRIAQSNSTVLITGESGTGKEMFARAIHEESPRSKHPFIAINCGAIPEALIESELFGYEKGAFTGAHAKGKPGKFELANKGTIFLDEIGTMPLYLQVKLLRVLQTKEIDKVGGTEAIPIDVRVIAATNNNLEQMVAEGTFRQDLYYRLHVIPIQIPPLRERKMDIVPLAQHFIRRYSVLLERNIQALSEEARLAMEAYHWPGNIRELENSIEYAINLSHPDETILRLSQLPSAIKNNLQDHTIVEHLETPDHPFPLEQSILSKQEYEKRQITHLLAEWGTSTTDKKRIARQLGISLPTLYRKIRHYQIENHRLSK